MTTATQSAAMANAGVRWAKSETGNLLWLVPALGLAALGARGLDITRRTVPEVTFDTAVVVHLPAEPRSVARPDPESAKVDAHLTAELATLLIAPIIEDPEEARRLGRFGRHVLRAARELGASAEALDAVFDAYMGAFRLESRDPAHLVPAEKAQRLSAFGEDGFRAIVAFLRCGHVGPWMRELCGLVWTPGQEELLITVAEEPSLHPYFRESVIRCLGVAPTSRTRDWLVARLGSEEDPDCFAAAADVLGEFQEPRGAETVATAMIERRWEANRRAGLAWALVKIDPAVCPRVFGECLRDPDCDNPFSLLLALRTVDEPLAVSLGRGVVARRGEDADGGRVAKFVRWFENPQPPPEEHPFE